MQKGGVKEYITQFDELRGHVMSQEGHHRESYYIDTFISGLKKELSQALYNNRSKTLQDAWNMARGQEYLLGVLDKRYKTSSKSAGSGYSSFSRIGYSIGKYTPPASTKLEMKNTGEEIRRLTLEEITDKKKKGLCFHCDEKFVPGHNCRKKKLFIIIEDTTTK